MYDIAGVPNALLYIHTKIEELYSTEHDSWKWEAIF